MAKAPQTPSKKPSPGGQAPEDEGLVGAIARQSRLPQKAGTVFWAALVVGLVLLAAGVWLWAVQQNPAMLILSAGLGVVLATLGSMAVVQYNLPVFGGVSTVFGGSAAITVGLFGLMYYSMDHSAQQFSNINLTNLPEGSRLTIGAKELFHTKQNARLGKKEQFDVLVPMDLLSRPDLISGNIEFNESKTDCERLRTDNLLDPCTKEIIFNCINPTSIKAAADAGAREVRWSLDQESDFIIDEKGQRLDGQDCVRSRPQETSPTFGFINPLMGTAWAEGDISIDELLKFLESDSTVQRRASRDLLSGLGEKAVVPLLQALARPNVSYRTRLGVCVALAEFMRDHKDQRKSIAELISLDDLGRLLDAAADRDRTIRIYASEFLYDLGDPRSVLPALERVEAANDNGKYNLLLVVKGSIGELGGGDRVKANEILAATRPMVGEKTSYLVDQILAIGTPLEIVRYWVIVGSFKDEEGARNFARMIASEAPELKPFVGKPAPDNPFYPVIVGDFVDKSQAEKLREAALDSKLVTDAYLSDYPYRR